MRKLIAILVILISAGLHQVSFAQNNSIAGVSLDLTSSDFMEQIGAKAAEIASSLKAKKCSVSVNEGLAKDIQKVCYVDINLEYKGSEDVMPLAMLRSAFNANTECAGQETLVQSWLGRTHCFGKHLTAK